MSEIDFGPLTGLIGNWQGDKGVDIAPEPDGPDENLYYETLSFEAVGDVDNVGEQFLAIVNYTQQVRHKSNDQLFHHQVGYFLWDAATETVTHCFTIPRGVALVAGGKATQEGEGVIIDVAAGEASSEWPIAQSPFMAQKASTTSFCMQLQLSGEQLSYQQTTLLNIYGNKHFEHTETNVLQRV